MAFTVDQLLLSDERRARLEKALANAGLADPLAQLIGEAAADVARWTGGYTLTDADQAGWIRTLTLHKAFTAAGAGVPKELDAALTAAKAEMKVIADGQLMAVGSAQLLRTGRTPAASRLFGGQEGASC